MGILVIRNGTLIDGTGAQPAPNDAIVVRDNRIVSIGPLPPDVSIADLIVLDRDSVADLTVLGGGRHLAHVIKDGCIVDRSDRTAQQQLSRFRQAAE
jgi:imidazolonepropionase-like amidohydrolase